MHSSVLKYLDQVARLGSIRRAAGVLNVASSAVNRQILKLEAEIGTPLFDRVGNGVRTTAAGDLVLSHARETLSRWQSVQSEVSALAGDLHGDVRILSIPASIVRVLPRAITTVSGMHPHITYGIIEAAPKEVDEEMRSRRPDIAIIFVDRRHSGYELLAKVNLRLGAIMRPDHPLARHEQVTLTQCASYPVVMMSDPWILNATAEAEFIYSGAHLHSIVMTNSLMMTKQIIAAGMGIAFFTQAGYVDELKAGDLVHVPLAEPELSQSEIGLLVHRERQNLPAVRTVAAQILEEVATLKRDIQALRSA